MSDFRKIGPAVVDASRVRAVLPFHGRGKSGVHVVYANDEEDFVRTTDPLGAIREFLDGGIRCCAEIWETRHCGKCGNVVNDTIPSPREPSK